MAAERPKVAARDTRPTMPFASAGDWEAWLREHHEDAPGVWLKIAKSARRASAATAAHT